MTNDKGIFIKNIYYMLTYAFQVLKQSNYDDVDSENFDNIQNLFSAILAKGIAQQIKQGLYREYITKQDDISTMRGKLDFQGTIMNRLQKKQLLSCEFDELSENNIFNQILKTTATILIRIDSVDNKYKSALKKDMLFFDTIDLIEPNAIPWSTLCFQKNNQNYQMLINICYFVLDGLIQTTDKGDYRISHFSDEHMSRLYEKFILEYYKKNHPYLTVCASQIKWDLSKDSDITMIQFLPIMKTDITLKYKDKALIIDAKYYAHTMQAQYDAYTIHSNNLYQIFTYVKNYDKHRTGNVSGMLLYAKTEEAIAPNCEFTMSGNKISVKTLDLNHRFYLIEEQLNKIVKDHFGNQMA